VIPSSVAIIIMDKVTRFPALRLFLLLLATFSIVASGFIMPSTIMNAKGSASASSTKKASSSSSSSPDAICISPAEQREATNDARNTNMAQYLVDLHDAQATFDFCGGMMFQLVLTDKLRNHLAQVAAAAPEQQQQQQQEQQPVVFDATKSRMHQIPNYISSADADNVRIFHGREIRQVKNAAGGMGMVLQLSWANTDSSNDNSSSSSIVVDPDGWTRAEIQGYDGWKHDVGRVWRNGQRLQDEGFVDFVEKFGPTAFTLNHRFYLHLDRAGALWLAAEDGCEGTPASDSKGKSLFAPIAKLFRL
jgi:hypothetical protein